MRLEILAALVGCTLLAGCGEPRSLTAVRQARADDDNRMERARALNVEGLRLAREGDYGQAEAAFRRALGVNPSCAAAQNNLGLIHVQHKRWYEAAVCFTRAASLESASREPHVNLAALYRRVGWQAEAEKECEIAQALEAAEAKSLRSASAAEW